MHAFMFSVVEAEDGAAWASCQTLQCHMRVINQNYYEVCIMVQHERLWRVAGETDLIQLVFCHPAGAGVVVGGLVVRQTVLQTQDRGPNLLRQQIFSLLKCP